MREIPWSSAARVGGCYDQGRNINRTGGGGGLSTLLHVGNNQLKTLLSD